MKVVVKLGGAALEDAALLRTCARAIVQLAEHHKVAVVHGGGAALTRTLAQMGKETRFEHGLRVTDAETRDVALMVLAGRVNKSLVAAMAAAGRPAIGLCGGDGASFRARKKKTNGCDLGYVGGDIRIMAGINGSNHDFWSNQFLAGVPPPQGNLGGDGAGTFTGEGAIDITLFAGDQFFTSACASSTAPASAPATSRTGLIVALAILLSLAGMQLWRSRGA